MVVDRTFIFGNGYNEVLAMFIVDEFSQTEFNDFLDFMDAWLCVDPSVPIADHNQHPAGA